ncbi:MAG: SOS response-associated peptidase [Rhodobacteraceae bacterium]|nr:SOS response-associated peptidase [Paracoccaceae bacterium]
MCGRFAILLPTDAMAGLFDAVPGNDLPEVPNYNVCPTNMVHVVRGDDGTRRLGAMRWGFFPHWYKTPTDGPLLINARSESIAEKPAFRAAVRERRCLIVVSGFYEWEKGKDGERLPWYVTRNGAETMALAGIWQSWGEDDEQSCAIVTTDANKAMSSIHHRVPVVIEPGNWGLWLGEEGKGAARLMHPPEDEDLGFHRVSKAVNSNRAVGPELIEPID